MNAAIAELEEVANRRSHNAAIYREGRSGAPITREQEVEQAEAWEAQAKEMRSAIESIQFAESVRNLLRD